MARIDLESNKCLRTKYAATVRQPDHQPHSIRNTKPCKIRGEHTKKLNLDFK